MATQKPISTISYNTIPFLTEKLDSWIDSHIIQAYQFIHHIGEDGDKDHTHLRVEPNKKLDPMDLTEKLKEFTLDNPLKPLGVRPWRPSKEEDWILYAVHDSEYLKLKYGGGDKGEKLPYNWTDIVVSDGYDMEIAFIRARSALKHTSVNMASRLQSGDSPLSLLLEGENVYTINAVMHALTVNDYQRVLADNMDLSARLNLLIDAVHEAGYDIQHNDDGSYSLVLQHS